MVNSSRAVQVMVVEDDVDLREDLCELLAFEGYDPIGCRDGRVAWTQLASGLRPDVIVTDLGLPQLSGRELVALVREQTWGQRMPILLLSGWGDATRFGIAADVVMVKGGDPEVFARAVDRLTGWRPQLQTGAPKTRRQAQQLGEGKPSIRKSPRRSTRARGTGSQAAATQGRKTAVAQPHTPGH